MLYALFMLDTEPSGRQGMPFPYESDTSIK
jgi:hypothetical protein